MSPMASQITSLAIGYSTVYSGTDQRKHQSSASLHWPLWGEFTGDRWKSPDKGSVTRKMFPFDDVITVCRLNGCNISSFSFDELVFGDETMRYLFSKIHVNAFVHIWYPGNLSLEWLDCANNSGALNLGISMLYFYFILLFAKIKTFRVLSKMYIWLFFPLSNSSSLCTRSIPSARPRGIKRNHRDIVVNNAEVRCFLEQSCSHDLDCSLIWFQVFFCCLFSFCSCCVFLIHVLRWFVLSVLPIYWFMWTVEVLNFLRTIVACHICTHWALHSTFWIWA